MLAADPDLDDRQEPATLDDTLSDTPAPDATFSGEEWLTEADVRDALDHIDPDVGYERWRNIGFALDDFFTDKATARSVFEAWSRAASKSVASRVSTTAVP